MHGLAFPLPLQGRGMLLPEQLQLSLAEDLSGTWSSLCEQHVCAWGSGQA